MPRWWPWCSTSHAGLTACASPVLCCTCAPSSFPAARRRLLPPTGWPAHGRPAVQVLQSASSRWSSWSPALLESISVGGCWSRSTAPQGTRYFGAGRAPGAAASRLLKNGGSPWRRSPGAPHLFVKSQCGKPTAAAECCSARSPRCRCRRGFALQLSLESFGSVLSGVGPPS